MRAWRIAKVARFVLLVVLMLATIFAIALAVRSYWVGYSMFYADRSPRYGPRHTWTYIARGKIWFGRMYLGLPPSDPMGWRFERVPHPLPVVYDQPLIPHVNIGWGYMTRKNDPRGMYGFALPLWLVAIVCGAWPAMWLMRVMRRRRRIAENCCRICGYDLRATPERCPECGTLVKLPTLASSP